MKRYVWLLSSLIILFAGCKNDRVMHQEDVSEQATEQGLRTEASENLLVYGKPLPGKVVIKVSRELQGEMEVSRMGDIQMNNVPTPLGTALNRLQASKMERLFRVDPRFEERKKREGLDLWYEVTIDSEVDMVLALQTMNEVPGIDVVEYEPEAMMLSDHTNPIFDLLGFQDRSSNMPFNDPMLSQQWHYNNTGSMSRSVMGADINLFRAWEITTGTPNVIVCIEDGGVDITHKDIKDNLWINEAELNGEEGVDDDGNGYIDDVYGYNFADGKGGAPVPDSDFHGTHVAGTVAARNNNGIGVCGVAGGDGTPDSGVRLMSTGVFSGERGQGGFAKAFVYAADNGAVISQNSWGNQAPGRTPGSYRDAIDYFIKYAGCDNDGNQLADSPMKGGVVIIASGNSNSEERYAPGEYGPAIAVNAMGPDFTKAGYSNYGTWTDITAPGGDQSKFGTKGGVLSTVNADNYDWYNGTSMACPHVSGVAALVVSHRGGPGFTAAQLEEYLLAGTHDIDMYNPGYEGKLGAGYIDAYLALTLENKNKAPEAPKFLPEKSKDNDFLSATIYWQVPKDADDGAPSKYELYISDKPLDKSNYTKATRIGNESGYVSGMNKEAGEELSFKVYDLKHSTTYYFAIVAIDRWGLKSAPAFMETKTKVNNPPVITNVPKEPITVIDIKGSVEYTLMVKEPDGQKWDIASEGETTGVNLIKTDDGIKVRIRPVLAQGDYTFTVVVTDELGTSGSFEIPFRVINVKAPELLEKLPNTLVGVENDPLTLDISKVFKPQELLEFSYKVSSSNGSVATAVVEGSKLTIKAFQPGKTTITITVSNGYYETRTSFEVSVTKNLDNEVYAVWPLPMKEKLNLWVNPKSNKPVITIYTMTGEKVMDKALLVDHEGMSSVKVKNLAPGTYRIRVTGTGKKPFEQVVQKR